MAHLLDDNTLKEVEKTDHIIYGYFIGKNRKCLYDLKTVIYDSPLNPVIIKDQDHDNAIYVKYLESEAEDFVKLTKECCFKKARLSKKSIATVKWIFNDGWPPSEVC